MASSKMKCNSVKCFFENKTQNGVAPHEKISPNEFRRKNKNRPALAIEVLNHADCQSARAIRFNCFKGIEA